MLARYVRILERVNLSSMPSFFSEDDESGSRLVLNVVDMSGPRRTPGGWPLTVTYSI